MTQIFHHAIAAIAPVNRAKTLLCGTEIHICMYCTAAGHAAFERAQSNGVSAEQACKAYEEAFYAALRLVYPHSMMLPENEGKL